MRIILCLFLILNILIFSMVALNSLIISNNGECIEIKFDEGENKNFCECIEKSKDMNLGWLMPELEQDYEGILNKFCKGY